MSKKDHEELGRWSQKKKQRGAGEEAQELRDGPACTADTRADSEWKSMETRLLCAGACWAGLVVPPADGLREAVKMVVISAFIVFVLGLFVSVKPGPSAFVDSGSGVLRLVPGKSRNRRRSEQDASTGKY
ncbi:MAG TPA: hypothetical protein VFB10_07540 [Candidatus Dormibacteraeota bacterium]|nr:hypothetical protein [Candidatus Dormibacteraeota bacterium]